jgi:catechol 2,3-dioxygenase-like lactoylglutathione lyase family enzyme
MSSTALAASERPAAEAVPLHGSTTELREPRGSDRLDVTGVDYLSIAAPELARSVAFYARVFGFRVIEASRERGGRSALMAAGRLYLAIHERPRGGPGLPALCFSFTVDDLDTARASIWNLGVVPLRDGTHEPLRDRPWRGARSFVIRDPAGNEIEVVERAG